jgi:hypothetical protein
VIYIGLDDTDNLESRGTGHMARELAALLGERYDVYGVTRHQLSDDPRVPRTKKNSCAALHLRDGDEVDLDALGSQVADFVREHCAEGSDPGVCVGRVVPEAVIAYARRAKVELVTQDEARALAADHGFYLRGLGGTEDGVIGALSAVALAASGDDGRFIIVGHARELEGLQPVEALLASGIVAVRDLQGNAITDGLVETGGKLRPAHRKRRPVLYIERDGDHWRAVKLD